ncbi:MAG: hypothetical protein JNJ53_12300 [Rhizobiales bacterium]|nr:hypothetical protein [Hyphomicrobiales bacterium]
MDWKFAIESKRAPLLGVVAKLFAEIGLTEGGTVERISKPLHRYVLGILRTAESAVRRLIVAAARDIVVEPKPRRPASVKPKPSTKDKDKSTVEGKAKRKRGFLFNLFDPLKRRGRRFKKKRRRLNPRITVIDYDPRIPEFLRAQFMPPAPVPAAPFVEEKVDDGTVNAKHLVRRLIAVMDALQDIPRYAMRLARWQARPKEERRPERWSSLRPGRPPGFRQRSIHEVDDILKECDWLARLGNPPLDDTS